MKSSKSSDSKSKTPAPSKPPSMEMFRFSTIRRAGGLDTIATTPQPTPPPTPDPFGYEKSVFHDRITDHDISMLKDQVRKLKGLPLTSESIKKKINFNKPPKLQPKPTTTSNRRKELQHYRMIVRCANLKEKYKEYEKSMDGTEADTLFRSLRNEALTKTVEERDLEFDQEELQKLKQLAAKAKEHEIKKFRENHGSQFRYRFIRGQPILSRNFRNTFADFNKPPFFCVRDYKQPKAYNMPKIDKKKEIWLFPINDEQGIPLHWQKKLPDPKDKRTQKEKTRAPVKKGKRTTMEEWNKKQAEKKKTERKKATKRPWGYYGGCPLNAGSYN